MGVNSSKLKYYIMLQEVSLGDVAKELGINPATLSRKMSGESDFKRNEIHILMKYLRLTPEVIEEIFFV